MRLILFAQLPRLPPLVFPPSSSPACFHSFNSFVCYWFCEWMDELWCDMILYLSASNENFFASKLIFDASPRRCCWCFVYGEAFLAPRGIFSANLRENSVQSIAIVRFLLWQKKENSSRKNSKRKSKTQLILLLFPKKLNFASRIEVRVPTV